MVKRFGFIIDNIGPALYYYGKVLFVALRFFAACAKESLCPRDRLVIYREV